MMNDVELGCTNKVETLDGDLELVGDTLRYTELFSY